MSRVAYTWLAGMPPLPDVYTTRRGDSKYQTRRYWDGNAWWEIAHSNSRGGKPFTWPKGSHTRKPARATWDKSLEQFYLRKIHARLDDIKWGAPYRVYDDKEVLAFLVKGGVLPVNWLTYYQRAMRAADNRSLRA